MTDIVERLRGNVPMIWGDEGFMITDDDTVLATFKEAADEIERLRATLNQTRRFALSGEMDTLVSDEIERLREALRYYANKTQEEWVNVTGADDGVIARTALGEKE